MFRQRCYWLLLMLPMAIVSMSLEDEALADSSPTTQATTQQIHYNNIAPYCGLYCVYGAAIHEHVDINFGDLLQTKYVPNKYGSTLHELQQAATDSGLYAIAAENLSISFLRSCKDPVVLHVMSNPQAGTYDHYILFLGFKEDQFCVMDPSQGRLYYTAGEIMQRWDGVGLVVSNEPINAFSVFAFSRADFAMSATAILFAIAAVKTCKPYILKKSLLGRIGDTCKKQVVLVFIASVTLSILFNLRTGEGLIVSRSLVRDIEREYFVDFLSKPNLDGARRLLASGNAVFIDARISDDFALGHISGALNIPVSLNDAQRLSVISNVQKSTTIVVYCQSVACPYSRSVAQTLVEAGYSDVRIFPGGWMEWNAPVSN